MRTTVLRLGLCVLGVTLLAVIAAVGVAAAQDLANCSSCHSKYPADSFDQASERSPVSLSACWSCHGNMLKHGTAAYDTVWGSFAGLESVNLTNPATIAAIHAKHKNTVRWTLSSCVNCHSGAACTACHGNEAIPHGAHTTLAGGANNYPGPTETYATGTKGTSSPYTYTASLSCTNASCHASLNATFAARPGCLNCHTKPKTGHPPSASFDQQSEQNPVSLAACWSCHGNMLKHGTASLDTSWGAFAGAESVNLANPSTIATIHAAHRDTYRWTLPSCVNCHRGAACSKCHVTVPHGPHTLLQGGVNNYAGILETYAKGTKDTTVPYTYTDTLTCTNASCHASMNTTFVTRPGCVNCHPTPSAPPSGMRGTMQLDEGAQYTRETTVTAGSSVSGATEMRLKSDGDWSSWETYAGSVEVSVGASDGTKTVYVEYRSAAGSTLVLSDSIVLDTTPPGVAVSTMPAVADGDDGWFRTLPSVSLTRDETGTTRFQWDATAPATWTESPQPVAVVSGVSEGTHRLFYDGSDVAGNAGPIADLQLKVDANGPSVPGVSSSSHPNEDVWYPAGDVSVSWTATDAVSGVTQYCLTLDASATTEPDPGADQLSTDASATYAGVSAGAWYFHVRARDAAGNWGAATHRRILIAAPAPENPGPDDCVSCHSHYPADSFDQASEQSPVSLGACWPCHGNMLKHGTAAYNTPYGAFANAESVNFANPATIAAIHAKHKNTVRWTSTSCANCHRGAACTTCHAAVNVFHDSHTVAAGGANSYPGVSETYSKGTKGTTSPYTYTAALTCTNSSCHGSMNATFVARPGCANCHVTPKTGHGDVTTSHASTTDMSVVCLTSGCHTSSNLVAEHESRTLTCWTCHANPDPARAATLQASIAAHDTSCVGCHPTGHGTSR